MISKSDITFIRSLADKKARIESNMFVAEGRKIVDELVKSNFAIEQIYCTEEAEPLKGVICNYISTRDMSRVSHLKTPTDYLAIAQIPTHQLDTTLINTTLTLALDDVQDPGNVGTIIRIADWFGIGTVLCSQATADCFNPKVVQATMGSLLRVKIHYCDLAETLSKLKTPIYGTFLEGDNIYDASLDQHAVVVMGNEGRGISPAIAKLIDRKLYIPPYPEATPTSESLNVATATAIICSEFRRR